MFPSNNMPRTRVAYTSRRMTTACRSFLRTACFGGVAWRSVNDDDDARGHAYITYTRVTRDTSMNARVKENDDDTLQLR